MVLMIINILTLYIPMFTLYYYIKDKSINKKEVIFKYRYCLANNLQFIL